MVSSGIFSEISPVILGIPKFQISYSDPLEVPLLIRKSIPFEILQQIYSMGFLRSLKLDNSKISSIVS